MFKAKDKHFISELDRFLAEFDRKTETYSESQLKEVNKYQRITALRDQAQAESVAHKIWERF